VEFGDEPSHKLFTSESDESHTVQTNKNNNNNNNNNLDNASYADCLPTGKHLPVAFADGIKGDAHQPHPRAFVHESQSFFAAHDATKSSHKIF
jgi:hypothetical protein